VAKSTHAGLPWLPHPRLKLGERLHFWPFDGWVETRAVFFKDTKRLSAAPGIEFHKFSIPGHFPRPFCIFTRLGAPPLDFRDPFQVVPPQ
jgi:hypothetical protein